MFKVFVSAILDYLKNRNKYKCRNTKLPNIIDTVFETQFLKRLFIFEKDKMEHLSLNLHEYNDTITNHNFDYRHELSAHCGKLFSFGLDFIYRILKSVPPNSNAKKWYSLHWLVLRYSLTVSLT